MFCCHFGSFLHLWKIWKKEWFLPGTIGTTWECYEWLKTYDLLLPYLLNSWKYIFLSHGQELSTTSEGKLQFRCINLLSFFHFNKNKFSHRKRPITTVCIYRLKKILSKSWESLWEFSAHSLKIFTGTYKDSWTKVCRPFYKATFHPSGEANISGSNNPAQLSHLLFTIYKFKILHSTPLLHVSSLQHVHSNCKPTPTYKQSSWSPD